MFEDQNVLTFSVKPNSTQSEVSPSGDHRSGSDVASSPQVQVQNSPPRSITLSHFVVAMSSAFKRASSSAWTNGADGPTNETSVEKLSTRASSSSACARVVYVTPPLPHHHHHHHPPTSLSHPPTPFFAARTTSRRPLAPRSSLASSSGSFWGRVSKPPFMSLSSPTGRPLAES